MLLRGETDDVRIRSFRPSVCNRLDRNTTGIVICAKTLPASRAVSSLLKNRGLEKYYHLIAAGKMPERGEIEGWLVKDGQTNQVTVYQQQVQGSAYSRTLCRTLCYSKEQDISLVEAQLITGKTHQLRAHLACIGHPILGDPKYGENRFGESGRLPVFTGSSCTAAALFFRKRTAAFRLYPAGRSSARILLFFNESSEKEPQGKEKLNELP